jgi:N-acetylmuramoyl-L-alanine amidase
MNRRGFVSFCTGFTCALMLLMSAVVPDAHGEMPGRSTVVVAIDAGHSLKHPGAVSARGKGEYGYNANMAILLLQRLKSDGYVRSFIINADGREMTLRERADLANTRNANLLISIHHDSVQPRYLKTWMYGSEEHRYTDKFEGYSLFYSGLNKQYAKSLHLANRLGSTLRQAGFSPALHHAERIPGEGRNLVDADRGIYRVDDFGIVKAPRMPAVLLECGIIVNRDEEKNLADSGYQQAIINAISAAIVSYAEASGR